MPRGVPAVAPPAWKAPRASETVSVDVSVITPMFGGGAEPREVDPDTPVRAAAVRGHLRFWWRATAGAAFTDPEELFRAEERLWGSAREPGSVAVRVVVTATGNPVTLDQLRNPQPSPREGPLLRHFLFPFEKQQTDGIPEAQGRAGVRFTLCLEGPGAVASDVAMALRAWFAFGGVGARTRRGCGALGAEATWQCPADAGALQVWLKALASHPAPASMPTLAGGRVLIRPRTSLPSGARDAWTEVARFWSRFRKGHVPPSPYTPMNGGRWLDHRTLSESHHRLPPTVALAKPYLGLPITYQRFPPRRGGPRDPFHGTLEAAKSGRMASPVILKPLALGDGSFVPLVAVLSAPAPEAVRIGGQTVSLAVDPGDPVLADLGTGDPLEAVLEAARRQWPGRAREFQLGGAP